MAENGIFFKIEKDLEESLRYFGLTKYEIVVYVFLIKNGISSAFEIKKRTGILENRIYDALASLEKKEFVLKRPGIPNRYMAMEPKAVFQKIADERARRMREMRKLALSGLKKVRKDIDPTESFWVIVGRKRIYKMLTKAIKRSKKEILIITNEIGIKKLLMYEWDTKIHLKKRKEGLAIKLILPPNLPKTLIREAESFSNVKTLQIEEMPRFVLADNETLFLLQPLPDKPSLKRGKDLALWSTNSYFANCIRSLFYTLWEVGK